MIKRWVYALLLVALLSATLACQNFLPSKEDVLPFLKPLTSGAASPAPPEDTAAPAAATSAPSSQAVTPHSPLEDPNVHSLRFVETLTLETTLLPESPATVMKVAFEKQTTPEAITHIVLYAGYPLALQEEAYQTSQALYVREGDEWAAVGTQANDVERFGTELWVYAGVDAEDEWDVAGQPATYQGQKVLWFHHEGGVPEAVASLLGPGTFVDFAGLTDLRFQPQKAKVDVYTTDTGVIVGEVVRLEGAFTQGEKSDEGALIWEVQVTDLNADLHLTLPEELHQAGMAQAPLPLPPGAQMVGAAGGLALYQVPGITAEDLLNYWTQEQGLTVTSQLGDPGTGMMVEVQKADGTTVQVMLSEAEDGVEVTFMSP